MQNTFLNNLSILEEINNGKTKSIHATSDENLVAFIPKGVDVTASGSGTKEHKERIQPELMMNHNILSFFNALEIPTSYIGLFENRALIHKKPAPGALKNIEAVVYFGVCPRSSALLRYPKEYGEFDGENYSTVQPSSKYLNEDKSVNLFDKPFIELFHKKCLIIKDPNAWDASAIDMVPEASVKNKSLYFDAKGNETRYAWSDPLLVPYYDEFYGHVLLVYSRTQDRETSMPIAHIVRDTGTLVHRLQTDNRLCDGATICNPVRKLDAEDVISAEEEEKIRALTLKALTAVKIACRKTQFHKAEMVGGKPRLADEKYDYTLVIDGKLEHMIDANGDPMITDDVRDGNMRWAHNGKSNMTAKSLYQTGDKKEDVLLHAFSAADGTKGWIEPAFVAEVKKELDMLFSGRKAFDAVRDCVAPNTIVR